MVSCDDAEVRILRSLPYPTHPRFGDQASINRAYLTNLIQYMQGSIYPRSGGLVYEMKPFESAL